MGFSFSSPSASVSVSLSYLLSSSDPDDHNEKMAEKEAVDKMEVVDQVERMEVMEEVKGVQADDLDPSSLPQLRVATITFTAAGQGRRRRRHGGQQRTSTHPLILSLPSPACLVHHPLPHPLHLLHSPRSFHLPHLLWSSSPQLGTPQARRTEEGQQRLPHLLQCVQGRGEAAAPGAELQQHQNPS